MAANNGSGFEIGNNNDDLTAANAGSTTVVITGGTAKISTAQRAHGTRSVHMVGTSESGSLYLSQSMAETDVIAVRFYVRMVSLHTAATNILYLGAGSSQLSNIQLTTAGLVRFLDDNNSPAWASANSLSLGVWYRIELGVKRHASTGTARVAIYEGDATNSIEDSGVLTSLNTGADSISLLRLGAKASTASSLVELYMDDWDYDPTTTSFIGPTIERLNTPVVVLGASKSPTTVGGSNGTQTVTWASVSGASSYSAYIADGDLPEQEDFNLVATEVTSPYTFSNLHAGVYSFGIQAIV